MIQTIKGPDNLEVVLDSSQIFPQDPGQGTPVMVVKRDNKGKELDSGTYWCAISEGELSYNQTRLSAEQQTWLDMQLAEVEKFMEKYSPKNANLSS